MTSKLHNFYKRFVYTIYHINKNDQEIKVMTFLCMVHGSHVLSLVYVLSKIFSFRCTGLSKSEFTFIGIIFLILQYIIFYRPNEWKKFFKEFENESKSKRENGSFLVWFYIVVSMFLPIIIPVIYHEFIK